MGRICSRTDDDLGEKQCGFKCGRGCVEQLFVVRQLCEKFFEKGKGFVLVLYGPKEGI